MGYKPDLSNSGGSSSPNWHKELAMCLMHARPELKGKILTKALGTSPSWTNSLPNQETWSS